MERKDILFLGESTSYESLAWKVWQFYVQYSINYGTKISEKEH